MRLAIALALAVATTPAWGANTLQTGCDAQGCRPVICASAKHCGVARTGARWRGPHTFGVQLRDQRFGAQPFDLERNTGYDLAHRPYGDLGTDRRFNPVRKTGYDHKGFDRSGLWPPHS